MRKNKRQIGAIYENMADEYLRKKGYRIVEKNFRTHYGEIDRIVRDKDNTLVFVEIKYRASEAFGDPLEAVDMRKQKRISRTALYYYTYHGYADNIPCRFDVIAIYGDENITHIENAFEFLI